jgi:hypothetical protein
MFKIVLFLLFGIRICNAFKSDQREEKTVVSRVRDSYIEKMKSKDDDSKCGKPCYWGSWECDLFGSFFY